MYADRFHKIHSALDELDTEIHSDNAHPDNIKYLLTGALDNLDYIMEYFYALEEE